jgi:hypothetical protein
MLIIKKGYSALPEHLNSREKVEAAFPDDDQYNNVPVFGKIYRWYQKGSKAWFTFSYRCSGIFKWRKYPKVLLAIGPANLWRIENDTSDEVTPRSFLKHIPEGWYLSRIQYYTRWHFAVQWPLMISFHFYFKAEDVPVYGQERPETDGKLIFFYWNHFDADLVYWMITSIFLGATWK